MSGSPGSPHLDDLVQGGEILDDAVDAIVLHECPLCGSETSSRSSLDYHIVTTHSFIIDQIYGCSHCELIFASKVALQGHLSASH